MRLASRPLLATLVIAVVGVAGTSTLVEGQQPTRHDTPAASGFLLSMGGSTARGMQPLGTSDGMEDYTNDGYPDLIAHMEAKNGHPLLVRRLGCPGATLGAALGTAKPFKSDTCYKPPLTQLVVAEGFLHRHHGDPGVVTIEFGVNTLRPCFNAALVDAACAATSLADTKANLPKLIARLKKAAGPQTHFIGLNFPDPLVVYPAYGTYPTPIARDTLRYVQQLNITLDALYVESGVTVANIADAFRMLDASPSSNPAFARVPMNVAYACLLTWVCTPVGPKTDVHPNLAGQIVMANTIMAVMPQPWLVKPAVTS